MAEQLVSIPRGIYAIPPTPFQESGKIDDVSLAKCLDFIIAAGGHGIVMPVNASESIALTDHERHHVTEVTVAHVAKRVPVVIGVSGASTASAVEFAMQAKDAGANALIAMPPYVLHPSESEIFEFTVLWREHRIRSRSGFRILLARSGLQCRSSYWFACLVRLRA